MTTHTIVHILADGAIIPIVLLSGYMLLFKVPLRERFRTYSYVLMAGLTAYLAAKLAGSVYQPSSERPFELLGVDPGASYLNNPGFPSDHALFAAFLTLAVWYATRNKRVALLLALLTLLMGLGRVLALVHTPLDVIGGLAFASLGALWYLQSGNISRITSEKVV